MALALGSKISMETSGPDLTSELPDLTFELADPQISRRKL